MTKPARRGFENLLAFRASLRRFERWSEEFAAEVGLTHTQHQLLVAIKGHRGAAPPAIREVADCLLLRKHSAGELVNRAEKAGLVSRCADDGDARVVRVRLTARGDQLVTQLTRAHLAALHDLATALGALSSA